MASSVGQRPGWPEGSETCPVGCSSQVRVPGEADRVSPRRADGKRQTEDGRGSWTESYPQWHMNWHMTRTGLYARDATGYLRLLESPPFPREDASSDFRQHRLGDQSPKPRQPFEASARHAPLRVPADFSTYPHAAPTHSDPLLCSVSYMHFSLSSPLTCVPGPYHILRLCSAGYLYPFSAT
ncbi:hypothetical protein E4U23_007831 [Claviceps purpurea]|nr:hypothetical protein E4U23_007831 [Claviceps purpurea]